jgi:hypothetical protein
MLDSRQDNTRRNASKDRGEEHAPEHHALPNLLVAGKADGVPRVVRGIVDVIAAGEACSGKEQESKCENEKAGGLPFANQSR